MRRRTGEGTIPALEGICRKGGRMSPERKRKAEDMFLEAGVWLLFFALLVPAGFVGYVIGQSTSHDQTRHGGPGPKSALISHATRTTSASR
jgi:hypothetical protein